MEEFSSSTRSSGRTAFGPLVDCFLRHRRSLSTPCAPTGIRALCDGRTRHCQLFVHTRHRRSTVHVEDRVLEHPLVRACRRHRDTSTIRLITCEWGGPPPSPPLDESSSALKSALAGVVGRRRVWVRLKLNVVYCTGQRPHQAAAQQATSRARAARRARFCRNRLTPTDP